MKRTLIGAAALALVAAVGIAVYVFVQLDAIVKRAIEAYAPDILQAKVDVAEVKLSPTSGAGMLKGLRIGNPKGFRAQDAATVGTIDIVLDPATVTKDVVLVKRIEVESPRLTYEEGSRGSNLDALQRNVTQYIGDTSPGERSASRKLIVERLVIRGGHVNYLPRVAAGKASLSFNLPDITLSNIGKNRGGVTPGELAQVIVDAVIARTVAAMGRNTIQRGLDTLLGR